MNRSCFILMLALSGALAESAPAQDGQQPPDELTAFTARQWAMADALCRRDMVPGLAQIAKLKEDLAAARKEIEEMKAAAGKDQTKEVPN